MTGALTCLEWPILTIDTLSRRRVESRGGLISIFHSHRSLLSIATHCGYYAKVPFWQITVCSMYRRECGSDCPSPTRAAYVSSDPFSVRRTFNGEYKMQRNKIFQLQFPCFRQCVYLLDLSRSFSRPPRSLQEWSSVMSVSLLPFFQLGVGD